MAKAKTKTKAKVKGPKQAAKRTVSRAVSKVRMKYRYHTETRLNAAIEEVKSLASIIEERGGSKSAVAHVQRAAIALQKADAAF